MLELSSHERDYIKPPTNVYATSTTFVTVVLCRSKRTDLFPFFLTRDSAVHRDVIGEGYANVVYAMGFAAFNDALAPAHPSMFHDAEVEYYNRISRARNRRLVERQRKTGSSASMIRTNTMVYVLQQTTCLQCGVKGWRKHPWRNWARCVRAISMGGKDATTRTIA